MCKCTCEQCRLWCGECYTNRRGRTNLKGHFGFRRQPGPRGGCFMKYLRRPSSNGHSGPVDPAKSCGLWLELYPALCEFLTEVVWEDGTVRRTGTFTMFAEDGAWKMCLSDRDSSCVAFVSAGTPTEVLETAERGLSGGALDWRFQKAFKPRRT